MLFDAGEEGILIKLNLSEYSMNRFLSRIFMFKFGDKGIVQFTGEEL